MTNYARFNAQTADLATEFGESMARKWFGDEAVDALPKFTRGKNKGKPKGIYSWTKVARGGWVPNKYEPNGGHAENRVGATIERKLCERVSSPGGVFVGDTILHLNGGETFDQKVAMREGNRLQTSIRELVGVRDSIDEKKSMCAELEKIVDGHEKETVIRSVMANLISEIDNLKSEELRWAESVSTHATPAAVDFATRCSDAQIEADRKLLTERASESVESLYKLALREREILDSVR